MKVFSTLKLLTQMIQITKSWYTIEQTCQNKHYLTVYLDEVNITYVLIELTAGSTRG